MPNCPKCQRPLDPVRRAVSPRELRIVGYYCPPCRYYDSLWNDDGLDQNGIGGDGRGGRELIDDNEGEKK